MSDGFEIRGDVYVEDMKKSLNRLSELTKKSAAELVKEKASTMARYLATSTMPVAGMNSGEADGASKAAHTLGMNAVSRDVGRVYMDVRKVMVQLKGRVMNQSTGKGVKVSSIFSKLIRENKIDEAEKIVRTVPMFASIELQNFDGGKRHREKQRNGRVHKSTKPVVIADSPRLREYVRAQRDNVGWTKAGWINAGRQANGKNGLSAKWITKHNAPARGQFKIIGAIGEAMLNNAVPWIDKKLNERMAMEAFDRSFRKDIDIRTKKILEREQRKK